MVCISLYVCLSACMFAWLSVCIVVRLSVSVCLYLYAYVSVSACLCLRVCVCLTHVSLLSTYQWSGGIGSCLVLHLPLVFLPACQIRRRIRWSSSKPPLFSSLLVSSLLLFACNLFSSKPHRFCYFVSTSLLLSSLVTASKTSSRLPFSHWSNLFWHVMFCPLSLSLSLSLLWLVCSADYGTFAVFSLTWTCLIIGTTKETMAMRDQVQSLSFSIIC